jgi:hypothetical protein
MGSGKRLAYYIDSKGIKKKSFCEEHDFEYNSFVQILTETRPFGIKMIDKVHSALPKLNIHWMLYGEGEQELSEMIAGVVNEPSEMYIAKNDAFEYLFLKYLENDKIKDKIYEIIQQKSDPGKG